MASLPFPTFIHQIPVDKDDGSLRSALPAVGTCRISPLTCAPLSKRDFVAIVDKNKEQAMVGVSGGTSSNDDSENKKLKKKYMKQGVAMASKYLRETLGLDVSCINVQIVLESKDVIETDGCLSACFLDAGCSAVVLEGTDMDALDTAKVPRERIVASFDYVKDAMTQDAVQSALKYANTISVVLPPNTTTTVEVDQILQMVPNKKDAVIFQLETSSYTLQEDLTKTVAAISAKTKDNKGSIALVDPPTNDLGMAYTACMKTDRGDGLYTTVVCTRSGEALGLVYSSKESVIAALECGRGVYYSRSRNGLWRKGDTSGHWQRLHRIDVDCDGDAIRFTVTQLGDDVTAFCHLNTLTCWGEPCGLRHLQATLQDRLKTAPEGSYTKRLFDDPELLRDKLVEEAQELSEAAEPDDVAGELADVLYFAMARAAKAGVSIDDAVAELDRRTRKVTRRKGDSKAFRIAAGDKILNKESA
mmetsp:Transcript_43957/g.106584  ORF Transcript_43957/g.106584 Transcript_43957/m.106584 type:complete len:474 (-) Transcript_43957:187-1608(-)